MHSVLTMSFHHSVGPDIPEPGVRPQFNGSYHFNRFTYSKGMDGIVPNLVVLQVVWVCIKTMVV